MVARYLLGKGHRRFAFIGEEQASALYRSPSQDRHDGFVAALRGAGIGAEDIATRLIPHSMDRARVAALDLLDRPRPPTAIFAHDDVLAGGALRAAHQRGLSVPGDVAVVGYDDLELAEALGLTTVRLPFEESGAAAAEILAAHLEEPDRSVRQVVLRLSLVQRESA
jgi:LacI family transcriptional regulator